MIGVSPVSTDWPSAAFCRSRWLSRTGSTAVPAGGVGRQNSSRSAKLRLGVVERRLAVDLRSGYPQDAGRPAAWTSACCPGVAAASPSQRRKRVRHQRRLSLLAAALSSCGLEAPGRGGRSEKSGGMESGARVVTWNSSGASRVKPKVRVSSSPLQAAKTQARRPAPRVAKIVVIAGSFYRRRPGSCKRERAGAQPVQYQRPPTPQTIAASATLNTYQDQPNACA